MMRVVSRVIGRQEVPTSQRTELKKPFGEEGKLPKESSIVQLRLGLTMSNHGLDD